MDFLSLEYILSAPVNEREASRDALSAKNICQEDVSSMFHPGGYVKACIPITLIVLHQCMFVRDFVYSTLYESVPIHAIQPCTAEDH